MNELAQALGRLAKGKAKRFTVDELAKRRQRMVMLNKARGIVSEGQGAVKESSPTPPRPTASVCYICQEPASDMRLVVGRMQHLCSKHLP